MTTASDEPLHLESSAQFNIEKVPERIEAAVAIMSMVSFFDDDEEAE